jgi:hypothetical protein
MAQLLVISSIWAVSPTSGPVCCAPKSVAARPSLILPIQRTHLDHTVLTSFAPVQGRVAPSKGHLGGAARPQSQENPDSTPAETCPQASRGGQMFLCHRARSVGQDGQNVRPSFRVAFRLSTNLAQAASTNPLPTFNPRHNTALLAATFTYPLHLVLLAGFGKLFTLI